MEYQIQSSCLSYVQGKITYTPIKHSSNTLDLNGLWLGPTAVQACPTALISDSRYEATALALIDQVILISKKGLPNISQIRYSVRNYRNTLDWLRMHSIYSLGDARQDDLLELGERYAKGNWGPCLLLTERWLQCINDLSESEMENAFHIRSGRITCINQAYWTKKIGWGWQLGITPEVWIALNDITNTIEKSTSWKDYAPQSIPAPTENMLVRFASWLNSLRFLPDSVDRIDTLAIASTTRWARQRAQTENTRTENISVDDAARIIDSAFKFIETVNPPLIALLNDGKSLSNRVSAKKFPTQIEHVKSREALEEILNVSITSWCASRYRRPKANEFSVTEIISAIQGASATLIGILTARRQSEICDPEKGIRRKDLEYINEYYSHCTFYIEKTLQDRVALNITAGTADLIQGLINLSDATNWNSEPIPIRTSIFQHFSLGARYRKDRKPCHFRFVYEKVHGNSLNAFIRLSFKNINAPVYHPHMLRRFFGLIYYYRFEHPVLRALSRHFFHQDIITTKTYLTDPNSRAPSESIAVKIGLNQKLDSMVYSDIQRILDNVAEQKLRETITAILAGDRCTGGFANLIRKYYRRVASKGVFLFKSTVEERINFVISTLGKHGHKPMPFSHSQCNAPNRNVNPAAHCFSHGALNRGEAGVNRCNGCIYQTISDAHLENITDDLEEMRTTLRDSWLSPIEKNNLIYCISNAEKIIERAKRQLDSPKENYLHAEYC